jgi:hypothetical protein
MAILFAGGPQGETRGVRIDVVDGRLRIRRLPPVNAQVAAELTAAVSLVAQGAQFRDAGLRVQYEQLAQAIVDRHPEEIARYLAEAGDDAGEDAA